MKGMKTSVLVTRGYVQTGTISTPSGSFTSMVSSQVMPEEIIVNSVSNLPDLTIPVMITPFVTTPVTGRTEKTSGFESVLSITIIVSGQSLMRNFFGTIQIKVLIERLI